MKLLKYAITVLLFIVIGAGLFVIPTEAHGVVEQYRDFACRRGHRFGVTDPCSEASVERTERGGGPSDRDGRQA